MRVISLDMYASAGLGCAALLLGLFLTRKLAFLKRFCIPAPVSGGLVFSLLALLLHALSGVECHFDGTVRDICMMLFFTSVGFQSDLKMLRRGGRPLLVMIVLVVVLIAAQNLISLGIARGFGLNPLVGLATGSIPMSGGHGTSGGFSPLLESMGLSGASSVTMAAATFGLVAGSLLGGPLGGWLIRRHRLLDASAAGEARPAEGQANGPDRPTEARGYLQAACILCLTMALGILLGRLLALTGMTFPTYFGALLSACILRNLSGLAPRGEKTLRLREMEGIGDVCLQLFLGMAMAGLRLWELASLALPMTLILLAQVTFMALYAAFFAFPLLGRSYDNAVLASGLCGFGLGAIPNAMANMSAVCYRYRYTAAPFFIVPVIGVMFVDIINTGVVTLLLNLIR